MLDAEEKFCDMITSYRWVFAMHHALYSETESREEALKALADKLVPGVEYDKAKELVRSFLLSNVAWIAYTMGDMRKSANQAMLSTEPHYLNRMLEQQQLLDWIPEAFSLENVVGAAGILDVGCGNAPYKDIFDSINTLKFYRGVDKRVPTSVPEEIEYLGEIRFVFTKQDVFESPSLFKVLLKDVNVIFMAEFLHCVPLTSVLRLLENAEDVQKIMILEIMPDSGEGLCQAFQFHMVQHGGWPTTHADIASLATALNRSLKVKTASEYHNMYILDK